MPILRCGYFKAISYELPDKKGMPLMDSLQYKFSNKEFVRNKK